MVTKLVLTSTTGTLVIRLISGLFFHKLSISAVNRPVIPFWTAILSFIFLEIHLLGFLVGMKPRRRKNIIIFPFWSAHVYANQSIYIALLSFYLNTYLCIYLYLSISIYLYIFVCLYVCVHVCMYVCMYPMYPSSIYLLCFHSITHPHPNFTISKIQTKYQHIYLWLTDIWQKPWCQ